MVPQSLISSIKLFSFQKEIAEKIIYNTDPRQFYMLLFSRRLGKDVVCMYIAIVYCLLNPKSIVTYFIHQERKLKQIIFKGTFDYNGKRYLFIDLLPKNCCKINMSDLTISFHNGSTIQFDNASKTGESKVGTNENLIIVSEASRCDLENLYNNILPAIMKSEDRKIIFQSTPLGRGNHFYTLFQTALTSKDWFLSKKTIYDCLETYPLKKIDFIRRSLSDLQFRRQYLCEFIDDSGLYIFDKYMKDSFVKGFYKSATYCALDLGINDFTVITFFTIEKFEQIFICECVYMNNCTIKIIADEIKRIAPDIKHVYLPHDAHNRHLNTAHQPIHEFRKHIPNFTVMRRSSLYDMIDNTRNFFTEDSVFFNNDSDNVKILIQKIYAYKHKFCVNKNVIDYSKAIHCDFISSLMYVFLSIENYIMITYDNTTLNNYYSNEILKFNRGL